MNWLVLLRRDKGLTQQDIADKAGITRQMLSAIERGKATPSVTAAKAIAEAVGTSWTKFFE